MQNNYFTACYSSYPHYFVIITGVTFIVNLFIDLANVIFNINIMLMLFNECKYYYAVIVNVVILLLFFILKVQINNSIFDDDDDDDNGDDDVDELFIQNG